VVAGFAEFATLVIVANWIFGFVDHEVRTARETPTYYCVVVTVLYSLSALLGGYWCAQLARTAHRQASIGLILLAEVVVLWTAMFLWNVIPRVTLLALALLLPMMMWAGARLRVRRHPVKPLMVRA
jgi:hypothetical protein